MPCEILCINLILQETGDLSEARQFQNRKTILCDLQSKCSEGNFIKPIFYDTPYQKAIDNIHIKNHQRYLDTDLYTTQKAIDNIPNKDYQRFQI